MSRPMYVVLIPAFNAAATLPQLLESLFLYVQSSLILVVDDGSVDRTSEAASKLGVRVLQHPNNLGKGAALRTGFDEIKKYPGVNSVITMDADLQHSPNDLPQFLEARRSDAANVYVGYRRRRRTEMPVTRRMSNSITSWLATARTGVPILDSQCGFRLIGREVLESVSLDSNGYEAETEFLIKAARHGFRIEFLPIQTIYADERSYMSHWKTTKGFLQTLLRDY